VEKTPHNKMATRHMWLFKINGKSQLFKFSPPKLR